MKPTVSTGSILLRSLVCGFQQASCILDDAGYEYSRTKTHYCRTILRGSCQKLCNGGGKWRSEKVGVHTAESEGRTALVGIRILGFCCEAQHLPENTRMLCLEPYCISSIISLLQAEISILVAGFMGLAEVFCIFE